MRNQISRMICLALIAILSNLVLTSMVSAEKTVTGKMSTANSIGRKTVEKKFLKKLTGAPFTWALDFVNNTTQSFSYVSVSGKDVNNNIVGDYASSLQYFPFYDGIKEITITLETVSQYPEYYVEIYDAESNLVYAGNGDQQYKQFVIPYNSSLTPSDYLTVYIVL